MSFSKKAGKIQVTSSDIESRKQSEKTSKQIDNAIDDTIDGAKGCFEDTLKGCGCVLVLIGAGIIYLIYKIVS